MIYREGYFDEDFKDYDAEPTILSDGDKFDAYCGMGFALLTDEHIKALQEGKALYLDINGGEYCCLIKKAEGNTNE